MRVLLVEDDRMIGESMQAVLRDAGYGVDWALDGEAALSGFRTHTYDLVLLDLGLPKKSGIAVLREIRVRNTQVPVLIVTARDAVDDRVEGLDEGADDYILKPFEMVEVLARIRAAVRRRGGFATPVMTNGVISLDPATREASRGDLHTRLSGKEFALLHALMMRPGAILSRSEIEERLYGWNKEVESNVVEFIIHSIRKKLGADAIKNVRGVGWLVSKEH